MNYEQRTMNYEVKNKANSNPIQSQFKPKTNPKQTQCKANSNPTCRGVASGEAGSNPISKKLQSPIFPGQLLINRIKRICCFYVSTIFSILPKWHNIKTIPNSKKALKKPNFLKCKRLNSPGWFLLSIGTLFAYSNSRNFLYTDDRQ